MRSLYHKERKASSACYKEKRKREGRTGEKKEEGREMRSPKGKEGEMDRSEETHGREERGGKKREKRC